MYIIHINIHLLYYRNISSKMNGSIILSEPLRSLEDCTPFRDVLFQAHLPNNLKGCHFWVQLKAVKVILMGFGLRVKLHGPYGLWRWWFFKSTYWIGMLYRAIGVPLRGNHRSYRVWKYFTTMLSSSLYIAILWNSSFWFIWSQKRSKAFHILLTMWPKISLPRWSLIYQDIMLGSPSNTPSSGSGMYKIKSGLALKALATSSISDAAVPVTLYPLL